MSNKLDKDDFEILDHALDAWVLKDEAQRILSETVCKTLAMTGDRNMQEAADEVHAEYMKEWQESRQARKDRALVLRMKLYDMRKEVRK